MSSDPAFPEQRATSREAVCWAFRLFLGRVPESTETIDFFIRECPTVEALARAFIKSPEFHRARISESGIGHSVPADKQFVMTERPDGTRFWINMQDQFVSRLIHLGDYEPIETAFVEASVRPGMHVLDIGANLGWFTVLLAKLVGPGGRVTAFEPRKDLFDYLSRTVFENRLYWVGLHNCALGDQAKEAELHWSKDGVNPGGTQLHTGEIGEGQHYNYQTVEMRVLDRWIDGRVDFIKIDVEGAEKLVFDGARRLLRESRPMIMAEVSPAALSQVSKVSYDEYMAFIASLDYTPFQFTAEGMVGEKLTAWPHDDLNTLINVVMLPDA